MQCAGKIIDIGRSVNNNPKIMIELEGISIPDLVKLQGYEKLTVNMQKFSGKRSLDANAYYWKLLGELARTMRTSNEEMHNLLLDSYGVLAEDADGNNIVHFMPESEDYLRMKYEHYRPTGIRIEYEGVMYCKYLRLKGSSEYNTQEMSRLIDGLIYECQQLGIETLPPAELERMMKAYAKKHDSASGI